MKIIDRYIAITYFQRLIGAMFAAIMIFLVVNLIDQLDKFIDSGLDAKVIFEYYYLFIPYIAYLVLPVATLLATLFTIGGMTRSNELLAIFISGVSFKRVLGILLIIATISSLFTYWLGEEIIPATNQRRLDIERYQVKRIPIESRARQGRLYFQLSESEHLYIDHYKTTTKEAYGIEIVQYEDGKILYKIDAEKMIWLNREWQLQGVVERGFKDTSKMKFALNQPMKLSHKGLEPDAFEKVQTKPEEMNRRELGNFVDRLKKTGGVSLKWEVEMYAKMSLPAAAVIIVLFGAPIAAVRRRGGPAMGFGVALFICFIYFGFIQLGKGFGYHGYISPWLGAWLGNIVFGVLGLFALLKSR